MSANTGFFRLGLFLSCLFFFSTLTAQILQQDFESFSTLEEFKGKPPNQGQVDNIDLAVSSSEHGPPIPILSLGSDESGKHLLVRKVGKQFRYFIRSSGINSFPALRVSFQLLVQSSTQEGKLGGLYLGNHLGEKSFYPDNARKWAQIGLFGTTNGKFYLRNELKKEREDQPNPYNGETKKYSGKERVTIIANNSGDLLTYIGPDGEPVDIQNGKIDIWIGNDHEVKSAEAFQGERSDLSGVKFLTWGNEINATFQLDDVFIEEVENVGLPVEFTSFSAELSDDDVRVEWETAMEKNSSHFEVERSLNGREFVKIGTVSAAVNSNVSLSYSFTDLHAVQKFTGTIFYRLYQIDIDGASEYGPLTSIKLPALNFPVQEVYPNPFNDELTVKIQSGRFMNLYFKLLNMQGFVVLEDEKIFEPSGLEQYYYLEGAEKLQPGIYILEAGLEGGEKHRFRVVKL